MTRLGRKASVSLDVKVIKSTDAEMLLEPDVRPPHIFHLDSTLTSFPPSKTHILLPSLQKLRIVEIECDLCQISLPHARLTADVWGYQYEQSRYSMDRLYNLKTCEPIILLDFGVCVTGHYFILCSARCSVISSRGRRTPTRFRPIIRLHS